MRTTRRTFLKTALATTAATTVAMPWVSREAFGQEELKLASFVPPTHSIWAGVLIPWAKEIEQKSGGKLKVALFPSMQLGGTPPQLYRQAVQGIADMVFTLPGYTSGDFPMLSLTELPGTATTAHDGTTKLWQKINEKYFDKELADTKTLMLWNSDSAGFMTREKPIKKIADVKGLRLRSPSAAQAAQIEHLGGIGVSMPVTQIYNGIERGTIDGTMIPMSAMIDFKLLEVVKRPRYEKLPGDLRKIIDATTGRALSYKGSADYDAQNTKAIALAKKERDVYTLSAAEHKEWLAFFAPLMKKEAERVDKLGLPGSKLVKSYGLVA
jgi:TRAP-type C4-dicarboxylate transport system substrate-binding protein